ncbi:MAG: hypothetical protein KR126chlam6_01567 [Candidatus Anoxychlamydiales bacterium]|nr:hypothetical protein [Candidatus Anoxychlamydiales bacterium]
MKILPTNFTTKINKYLSEHKESLDATCDKISDFIFKYICPLLISSYLLNMYFGIIDNFYFEVIAKTAFVSSIVLINLIRITIIISDYFFNYQKIEQTADII